jgi:hypothetical protein
MLSLRTILGPIAILACLFMAPPTHAADRCMDTADELFFKVKSWSGLRKWFEVYEDCDDGYLAEGVSDYVVVSLAQRWRDLPKLRREMERNPRFEAFVLRHIDATTDSGDLEAIIENATQRCPSRSVALCASMIKGAQEALEESKALVGRTSRIVPRL